LRDEGILIFLKFKKPRLYRIWTKES